VDLNRKIGDKGPAVLTWFIHYDDGVLFVDRPAIACPFNDPDLYIPVRWGDRVVCAASRYVRRVEVSDSEIVAVMFDGSRENGTDFVRS